jgi:electron transfer flavoprotein alpha subunit
MSQTVLVLLDHADGGALRPQARELLTAARAVAAMGDDGVVAGVWVAAEPPSDAVLAEAGAHGATSVHHVVPDASARLTPVVAEALAALVSGLGGAGGVRAVLLGSTFENKEVAARLAVLTGAGATVDVAALETGGERPVAVKQVFAATWTTRCEVVTDLAVLALKSGAVEAVPLTAGAPAALERRDVAVSAVARAVELVGREERPPSGRPDLSSAQVVVVGGRGTEGDFGPLEELADVIGGAVGATRVATDEGWIDRDTQIGQTGVTVSPRLYIGAGVSGAVHHRGGMQASGTIVAINTDSDAPIFEIADLGIVGDLRQVLPQATAELRRLLG